VLLKIVALGLALAAALLLLAWAWLRGPDIPYATLEARYAGKDSAYADLPGGIRLHYREAGDPASPALVLVHGFGDAYTSWDGWISALAPRYHLYAIDLPGHGLTQAPAGYAADPARYVEVLEQFAASRGLARFALAGNSMGGDVAWRYALKDPAQLTALILVDAAGWPLEVTGQTPLAFRILRYRLGRDLLARIDNRPLIEQGLNVAFVDRAALTPAFLDRWAGFQRAPGHRAILMSISMGALGGASRESLAAIRVPTLVLHGEQDRLIPVADGRRFAAAIAGARLIVYPNVGHLPQVEIAARSARDAGEFLEAAAAAR
jgi:pimeloyl-ACP methyl ester carboxylesterase